MRLGGLWPRILAPKGGWPAARESTQAAPGAFSSLMSALFLIMGRFAAPLLGFLGWMLAARLYPQREVGLASGTVSAMMLCVQFALLGLGSAVIHAYPAHRLRPSRLLDTAFSLTGGLALVAAILFLTVASVLFQELKVVSAIPSYAVAFMAMVLLGTIGVLLDHVSIALRRGDQVFARNTLVGVATVVATAALALTAGRLGALAIMLAWAAANVLGCGLGALQLHRSAEQYGYRPGLDRGIVSKLLTVGLPNYALTVAERSPAYILPIVVVELLSPAANATWYMVWMMAWVVFSIPMSFGQTLFADLSERAHDQGRQILRSVLPSLALGAAAAVAVGSVAGLALSILGHSYALDGLVPLRILVCAVIPATLIQSYYAVCRAAGRLREATIASIVSCLLGVGAAMALAEEYGIMGIAAAWLAVQCATAIWSLWRLRSYRARQGVVVA